MYLLPRIYYVQFRGTSRRMVSTWGKGYKEVEGADLVM